MTPRLTAALLAGALLTAAPTFADVDLRGPGLATGDAYIVVGHTETEASDLAMTVQGQQMDGEMSTVNDATTRFEILAAQDGSPTHVRETTEELANVTQMTMLGQTQEQEQGQEMVGVVLDRELTDEGWQTEVVAGNLPPEAQEMLSNGIYAAPYLLYPAEPVAVGASWTVDGETLSLLSGASGLPGANITGEAEFELVEVRDIDGVETAVIHYSMDMRMEMKLDQPGMAVDIDVQMIGGGEILRRLDTYMDDKTFEGTMAYDMTMGQAGQTIMEMASEMPVTSRTQMMPADDE